MITTLQKIRLSSAQSEFPTLTEHGAGSTGAIVDGGAPGRKEQQLGANHAPDEQRSWAPALLALGFVVGCVGAYGVFNRLPFDSFSIAWDRRQVLRLALHYLVLTFPFFCSGAVLSLHFSLPDVQRGRSFGVGVIYASCAPMLCWSRH